MSLKDLLDDQIDERFKKNPELKKIEGNEFEIAVADFACVKHLFGINYDDLEEGIIGNGGDEGVDMCYLFCDGRIIKNDALALTKDSTIVVKFFQTKKTNGFSTTGYAKFCEGINEIFDTSLTAKRLAQNGANQKFIEVAELVRSVFRNSRRKGATFSCEVFYATASILDIESKETISPKILEYQAALKKLPLEIPFAFYMWGAKELLALTRHDDIIELDFEYQPSRIMLKDVDTKGWAGFADGNDLISALSENGKLRHDLTEGNVREFLGEKKSVNNAIIDTAQDSKKAANFWAMNNGLTILCEHADMSQGKTLKIKNPQIVNGCQTIHCLYIAHEKSESKTLPDGLKVFVKIVESNDGEVQTDIISATNNQNQVIGASLKANDPVQKHIETYLKKSEIYYERRENFYKKQGFSGNKVVSLYRMAQIVNTVVNKESVYSITNTAELFSVDLKYKSIFFEQADFDLYKFSVQLFIKIWSYKNSDLRSNSYDDEKRFLIQRGGYAILHIMSSLLFSNASFKDINRNTKKKMFKKFSFDTSNKTNEFSKRKESLFKMLNDDTSLHNYYSAAKDILLRSAEEYHKKSKKPKTGVFKVRNFDSAFLIPEIAKYLKPSKKK